MKRNFILLFVIFIMTACSQKVTESEVKMERAKEVQEKRLNHYFVSYSNAYDGIMGYTFVWLDGFAVNIDKVKELADITAREANIPLEDFILVNFVRLEY